MLRSHLSQVLVTMARGALRDSFGYFLPWILSASINSAKFRRVFRVRVLETPLNQQNTVSSFIAGGHKSTACAD